ncbi:MAG: acyltransferase [Rikenellaceae bacterium]|nr:acyltransferase [Rikenellaceae bacterium]MCL2693289.1 acyltransferase [Rikenellaceae bacterium]
MIAIDDILNITGGGDFEAAAMEVFYRQARECAPYREYLSSIGVKADAIKRVEEIPFLPIELFKTHYVYCAPTQPETVFTSSGTGGEGVARHYIARAANYEKTFRRAFEMFYGDPARMAIYALLPGYAERTESSLIYMIDSLIRSSGCGRGGFYLRDHERLLDDLRADAGPKILFGVSHALLDLAESGKELHRALNDAIVMETGGMKGRREEMSKEELHAILCHAFGVGEIHSEYGMAELSSQAYSGGRNIFRTPPWMRVSVRDLNDPFARLPAGARGGINIIDLANLSSCAFIQTHDVGLVHSDGSFSVFGRADRSEIRGCNLLVL